MIASMQAVPRAEQTTLPTAVYLGSTSRVRQQRDIVIDGGLIWGRRYSEASKGGGTWSTLLIDLINFPIYRTTFP